MELDEALRNTAFQEKRNLSESKLRQLCKQFSFNIKEMTYLKNKYAEGYGSFLSLAPKGIMNLDMWKKSLGIINVPKADHLARQIFKSIDTDKDGYVEYIIID